MITIYLGLALAWTVRDFYSWHLLVFTASVGSEQLVIRTRDARLKAHLREFIRVNVERGIAEKNEEMQNQAGLIAMTGKIK